MRTRYTVWEWDEFNGWSLYLGSNNWSMADQIKRALKTYAPQHYFGVYGPYEVPIAYEIVGSWQGRNYSWGYTTRTNFTSEILYALAKAMRPDVILNARDWNTQRLSSEPYNEMPSWWRAELIDRKRAAGIPV